MSTLNILTKQILSTLNILINKFQITILLKSRQLEIECRTRFCRLHSWK